MERDPETYETICALRVWIKEHAELQRVAKVARRTVRGTEAEREAARVRLGIKGSRWSPAPFAAASFHNENRFWLTAAYILYGQLRGGKQHEVRKPKDYSAAVEGFVERKLGRRQVAA